MPTIQRSDVGIQFVVKVVDEQTNATINLSQASNLQFIFRQPDKTVYTVDASFYTDGTDGKIQYISQSSDLGIIITSTSGNLYGVSIYFDINAYLNNISIKNTQLVSSISESTDLNNIIVAAINKNINIDVSTYLNEQIIRNSKIIIFIYEQSDFSMVPICISPRGIGLDISTYLTDQIIRDSAIIINLNNQIDFATRYITSSPTQNITSNIDVATTLLAMPGVIGRINTSFIEQTDVTSVAIRNTLISNNISTIVDCSNFIVNASARILSITEQTDVAIGTGRFIGENILLDVEIDLSAGLISSGTIEMSTSDNLDVETDIFTSIFRKSKSGINMDSQTDFSLYTLRGSIVGLAVDCATSFGANNCRRLCYTIPTFDSVVSLTGEMSAKYAPSIILSVDDNLTVLVGVAGLVVPIQVLKFTVSSISSADFTLTSINQFNSQLTTTRVLNINEY